jgi:hypothetical protein
VKEAAMIELTEQQRQELSQPEPTAIDPRTRQLYVLVRKEVCDRLRGIVQEVNERADWDDPAFDVYDRLKGYDDSPWTDEERDALAWEAGQSAGWDDMDDYDHYRSKGARNHGSAGLPRPPKRRA